MKAAYVVFTFWSVCAMSRFQHLSTEEVAKKVFDKTRGVYADGTYYVSFYKLMCNKSLGTNNYVPDTVEFFHNQVSKFCDKEKRHMSYDAFSDLIESINDETFGKIAASRFTFWANLLFCISMMLYLTTQTYTFGQKYKATELDWHFICEYIAM